jgi:hypothetical protein
MTDPRRLLLTSFRQTTMLLRTVSTVRILLRPHKRGHNGCTSCPVLDVDISTLLF